GFDTGIADPNFILVRKDGSYLVSDDGTNKIYLIDTDSTVSLWSDAIPFPNGIALSPDESVLYAAQIFTGLDPIGFDDSLWALPVKDGRPAGEARVVAKTGEGGLDGLAMDEFGRVYVADNGGGKVWRFDPETEDLVLIAEGTPSVASLVFGEGDFDRHAIYATSTFRGGGTIWKMNIGVAGARLHR
ncbi:MAG: SMP-30/gluconolactonase/LRE family protein, partial [Acidobacteriota bacterium]|nr:SMP-30/gluconolactonase/LRE family protein [Acidobacteriota bacterium]